MNTVRVVIIALAYLILGKLGLMLAIPPGYATIIWPSAGVAVAALATFGYRVWPGVFLGSFLVNLSAGPGVGVLFSERWLETAVIPIGIAIGAAVQAVTALFLVRRFAGFPNRLETEKQVLQFLVWAGPLACAANSIIGTSILFLTGTVTEDAFLRNLLIWWLGDTIGVFIFAPVVLVWLLKPLHIWKPRRLPVTVPALICLVITVAITMAGARYEREKLTQNFIKLAVALPVTLEDTLRLYTHMLDGLAGLHAANGTLTREQFKSFYSRSLESIGGIQAVSWNPVVYPEGRESYERATQAEGFKDFKITERNSSGELVPAQMHPDHVVVSYIEPYEKNVGAHGFDVGSNATRRAAFERARDTGLPVATGRITLVQETEKQFGVLVFMPVYRQGVVPGTIEGRRQNIEGYMVGVLRGGDIVSAAFSDVAAENLTFSLFDDSAPPEDEFLYASARAGEGVRALEESGLFGGASILTHTANIDFAGRNWYFEINPTPEFIAQNRTENSWVILVGGAMLTGLLIAFFMLLSGRREYLRELVAERTRELSASQKRLAQAQRIASFGNFQLDVSGERMWWSDEVDRILGMPDGRLKRTYETLSSSFHHHDLHKLTRAIEDVRSEGGRASVDCRLILGDGQEKVIHAQMERVTDTETGKFRIDGTIQDITERVMLDRMKHEFIANTSHELRTPLTSIRASLGLLMSEQIANLPEKAKQLITLSDKNAARLARLVNDLLDLETANSTGFTLNSKVLDLQKVVREAVEVTSFLADEFGVNIVVELGQPVQIYADKDRLIQVFVNLISNAAKFSPSGGEIKVSVSTQEGAAFIAVADQGDGIAPGFRDQVFKPFSQADGSAARRRGGTGLGLYIAKTLTEIQGGRISFDTELGNGTTFMVELPVAEAATSAEAASSAKVA